MKRKTIKIIWPNGKTSFSSIGEDWLDSASKADIEIPTGCLNGSCGACEIEVDGKVIRACIGTIQGKEGDALKVNFFYDPYW